MSTIYRTIQTKLNNLRNVGKTGEIGVKGQELSAAPFSLSDTKSLFQVFINGNPNIGAYSNERQSDIKEIMKYNYPEIYEVVKMKYADEFEIYDDLVVIETTFIFDIIKELYDRYANIKILTCHDAIYVQKSYQDKVKEIWDRRFLELIKDLPVISEAAFSQSHLDIMDGCMTIIDDDDDF